MPQEIKLIMTSQAQNVSLIRILTEIGVNQKLLTAIYSKVLELPTKETERYVRDIRKKEFDKIITFLSKYGDIDVPGLLNSLHL